MKLINLIFLLLAIQMTLFIFINGNMSADGSTGPYNESSNSFFCHYATNYSDYNDQNVSNGTLAGVRYSSPDLWSFIMCPADGNSSRMIGMLWAFAWLMGAVGFFAFASRSDISLKVIPFLFVLGAGTPTITQLYSFINGQVSAIACGSTAVACFVGQFFAVMIAGPLAIMWVLSCVDFWFGSNSTS